jgi:hypothetical protein
MTTMTTFWGVEGSCFVDWDTNASAGGHVLGLGAPVYVGGHDGRSQRDVAGRIFAGLEMEGGTYYLFSSGPGIEIRSSIDGDHWSAAGSVFAQAVPAWPAAAVPGATSIWAPDVSFFGGQYHLYYAVSSAGRETLQIHRLEWTVSGWPVMGGAAS